MIVRDICRDLWTSGDGRVERSVVRSLFYLVPIALIVCALYRDLYSGSVLPTTTDHPEQAINVAINAHFCGKPAAISQHFSVQSFLSTRPDLLSHPYRTALAVQGGSMAGYCQSVTDSSVVPENSLMWLIRFALWLNPRLTPDGLGRFLGGIRVAMLLVFGWALLRTGASAAFTLTVLLAGCAILRALGVRDSNYPFIVTLPLLHSGLYGMASISPVMRRQAVLCLFAVAMGVLTAFSASMRTILLPMGVAMFGTFVFVLSRQGVKVSRPLLKWTLGMAVGAYCLGFVAYVSVFVWPLRITDKPNVSNYTYHTFAHQLVLGLAVPENDLSRREGIEWRDEVGATLAKRGIPEATYLGPQYEAGLLRYYAGLWYDHPREMAGVYYEKLRHAGSGVFLSAALVGTQFFLPRAPAEWLDRHTNGFVLVGLAMLTFVVALRRLLSGGNGRLLIVALVSLAAFVSLVESFLIYSSFVAIYFGTVLMFVFFISLVTLQTALDAVVGHLYGRSRERH